MVQVSVSGEPVWLSEAWAPGMEKKEKLSLTQTTVQFSSCSCREQWGWLALFGVTNSLSLDSLVKLICDGL